MKKYLALDLLKGVAAMVVCHGIEAYTHHEPFFSIGLLIYTLIGLPVGYVIYRSNKKFRNLKP